MKALVCMRTNAENMKMRTQNPCRKIEGPRFLVDGFLKVNCIFVFALICAYTSFEQLDAILMCPRPLDRLLK